MAFIRTNDPEATGAKIKPLGRKALKGSLHPIIDNMMGP